MVNAREEFADVAFQDETLFGVIFRDFPGKNFKSLDCSVRPLPNAAGVGVVDEFLVEVGIQGFVEEVMEDAVSDRGFVDVTGFRVGDVEGGVTSVGVSFGF